MYVQGVLCTLHISFLQFILLVDGYIDVIDYVFLLINSINPILNFSLSLVVKDVNTTRSKKT